ncbi:hypothetical protein HOT49_gp269 [Erwinia phage vB_EamM_Alexandra]|uniref:Uncharacterized protein n=1 Tax=Erwinia phage vB_EamM_Alexandra TaxID=2201424 RepID=A0A2Z4QE57_9CAUD|nr:hypothetical protein HOT49_gp269 [Erwinia phage vB_EamM_Alexandra]AWY08528.1 hypothetical protein Alexandra_271 [Erwinia phage vB_EamM_Alexandra]
MIPELTHIFNVMMTSLKDIRSVDRLHLINKGAVRFHLKGKQFDVRGTFPMFSVHEVDSACLLYSKAAKEIETQLNGEPIEELEEVVNDEVFNDTLIAHVDSMDEQHVRAYNEECGGPDLDPINGQRTWLKTHFLHIGHNTPDLLETVLMMEGKERRDALAEAIKGTLCF